MAVLKLPFRSRTSRLLLIAAMFGWGYASTAGWSAETSAPLVANSNQVPAGQIKNGVLRLELEAAMGDWYPEEAMGPAIPVAAFREAGGTLSTPGPLIRVPEGTEIQVTVRNRLDATLTLHGLHARPGDAKDVLVVAPGETREVHFAAGVPGTYFYWASRNGAQTLPQRRAEDGQLNGALLVDPKGANTRDDHDDRTLIITNWFMVDDDIVKPPEVRDVLGINGRSWPHTERLTYRVGERVHWRVINASSATHPMHLHGFYFQVDSVGDSESDLVYSQDQRRMGVTELLRPGRTFSLTWTPDRSGNWVFHCHVLPHISPQLRYWRMDAVAGHNMADHAREGMAGLVMGITVLPTRTPAHASPKSASPTRNLELVATELPGTFGKDPGMAFAIAGEPGSALEPKIPGPPLVLTQGEPAAIRVVNRLPEPLAVHWHGIELESYFDGVPGVSGSGQHLMPAIAAGKTFVVRFTPPRAGTFIYHTHMDDVRQLSSGLYGPLIVLPPGKSFHPETDRVLIISKAGPGIKPVWLNGSASPELSSFKAGQTYRLRIINILPENPPIDVALKLAKAAETVLTWRPVAKDGADLPEGQRTVRPAQVTISVGETYDFEFRPETTEELTFEAVRPPIMLPAEITPSHKVVELRPESRIVAKILVR